MGIIESCKAWLAALPTPTLLEQVNPEVEDGLSLSTVRARIKKLKNQVEVLKGVPVPPSNIREKVQTYVQGLTRPIVGGIALGEALTVQWPRDLHALMAFLQQDVLVDRLMAEINRIANTPCALPEREQRIAELEQEVDRLQRTEEAIVVATGAARERGCPPWVVLGVKAVEMCGAERHVM
jgi:Tfp pilus assembly protein PilN